VGVFVHKWVFHRQLSRRVMAIAATPTERLNTQSLAPIHHRPASVYVSCSSQTGRGAYCGLPTGSCSPLVLWIGFLLGSATIAARMASLPVCCGTDPSSRWAAGACTPLIRSCSLPVVQCKACVRAGLAIGLFPRCRHIRSLRPTPPTPQGSTRALLPSPFSTVIIFLVVKYTS